MFIDTDGGDLDAESRLLARYRADDGLHPSSTIVQASPVGDPPIEVDLTAEGPTT